ncbi:hypothetical protein D9M71_831270 [compost metagenome]
MAAFGNDVGLLLGGFHAFGNHLHAQALAQLDDGANDGRIVVVIEQVLNEALVDLDLVQRQALEIAQG